jgi:hypothetical protein
MGWRRRQIGEDLLALERKQVEREAGQFLIHPPSALEKVLSPQLATAPACRADQGKRCDDRTFRRGPAGGLMPAHEQSIRPHA